MIGPIQIKLVQRPLSPWYPQQKDPRSLHLGCPSQNQWIDAQVIEGFPLIRSHSGICSLQQIKFSMTCQNKEAASEVRDFFIFVDAFLYSSFIITFISSSFFVTFTPSSLLELLYLRLFWYLYIFVFLVTFFFVIFFTFTSSSLLVLLYLRLFWSFFSSL